MRTTNTHFFSKHQGGDDVAGRHGEIPGQIHGAALVVDQHLKKTVAFSLFLAGDHMTRTLLVCHLSQLEGLSLYHVVQGLLAAALQGALHEAAVGLPLLGVVPQRDGAPPAGHDVSWQKVRISQKCHRCSRLECLCGTMRAFTGV